jgi:zinc protease
MCSVQVWLRAGSADERPGETGSAHMLEHMMFRGSNTVPDGEFDARMESLGAIVNASTWVDSTSYTTLCAPEVLNEVLALEADRHRGIALKSKILVAERDVVANERRQVVDASAEAKLRERFVFAAQRGTPYAWPVIGWAEDIEAYTSGTLRAFFERCYAPSRTHVVFCGPIDAEEAERLATEHFAAPRPENGWRPADLFKSRPPHEADLPEEQENPERFVEFPVDVSTPIVLVGFEAPARLDADWPAWRVATSVLCGGESARLPQQLEFERAVVLSIDLEMYDTRMPLVATLEASTRRGSSADDVLGALDDV